MTKNVITFHLPTKPLSLVDKINRCASATGSVEYAQLTEFSDYNGHSIRVSYNDYRDYYIAEYQWGRRVVISRGDCETVLRAAIAEFTRQGRGASLSVSVREEDAGTACALGLIGGFESVQADVDWRFSEVANALRIERTMNRPATTYLLQTTDRDEYDRLCFPVSTPPN